MNDLKRKKLNKVFKIILLLLLITTVIGVTYAMYNITLKSSENSITTGLVSMSYTESTNVISIENALPISDTDGKKSTNYFDFSVTSNLTLNENDSNVKVSYSIDLEPLSTNTLNDNQIKVYLENTSTNKVLVDSKLISNLSNYKLYSTNHEHKYNVNTVTTNYRLKSWIDYYVDSSNWSNNGYEYKFRVNVNGDTEVITPAVIPTGSALATIANSVTNANISYKYINGANQTIDGIAYNVNDNGVFLYDGTDDNNGDYLIYYYRGNVTNNNVIFANMCWKIVRTTSTGGIKLVYNGIPSNGTCNNTGSSTQLETLSSFINYPSYVGYMYGEKISYYKKDMASVTDEIMYGNGVTYSNGTYTLTGKTMESTNWSTDRSTLENEYFYTCLNSSGTCSSIYYIVYFGNTSYMYYLTFTDEENVNSALEKMFSNTIDSSIKTTIDNWYSTNLTSYTNKLENTIFCNDRSFASEINNSEWLYSAGYERYSEGTPSLECAKRNDQFSLSTESGGTSDYGNNALIYPVGLLTSDEVIIAGGQHTWHDDFYLRTGSTYNLGTPYSFVYDDDFNSFVVSFDGGLNNYYSYSSGPSSYGVRPVISLKLGTTFEPGTTGEPDNPYIVVTE